MDPHTTAAVAAEMPAIVDRADADHSFVGRWLPLLLVGLISVFVLQACLTQAAPKQAAAAASAALPFDPAAAAKKANDAALVAIGSLSTSSSAADMLRALNQFSYNFADGSSDLPADGRMLADLSARVIGLMPPGTRLLVIGHTDDRGAREANLALSRQRAETVRNALVASGVPATQLATEGVGDSKPVASNDTDEGRFRNRRVELSLAP